MNSLKCKFYSFHTRWATTTNSPTLLGTLKALHNDRWTFLSLKTKIIFFCLCMTQTFTADTLFLLKPHFYTRPKICVTCKTKSSVFWLLAFILWLQKNVTAPLLMQCFSGAIALIFTTFCSVTLFHENNIFHRWITTLIIAWAGSDYFKCSQQVNLNYMANFDWYDILNTLY